ncbi:MAG: amidohydrolase family protein, partial [Parachlamydia sp.]|nr:amidohydrolase family protein [Parachlamydia sp.]
EYFIERYGSQAAKKSPPIRRMLELGIPVGAGTDATRVASYNPWISLYWLVSGKTVGGTSLYGPENQLERLEALRLYTRGSARLSREENQKGNLSKGMYADLAVLSDDYFDVNEETIKHITSVMTVVDGRCVYADQEFAHLDEVKELPVSPDWSPVRHYKGFFHSPVRKMALDCHCRAHAPLNPWSFGCDCFAY